MKNQHLNTYLESVSQERKDHETVVKKMNALVFEVDLVESRRPNLWMQQIDRSGNEYSQAWQILRAFGLLLGFGVWVYLMMWFAANGGLK